ncbi:hypothetical protein GGR23_003188 [Gellertiella hungarica]|uniref:Uncharacterized protein n=1 Tax=Gellertiella hungarica TaxID=1572859 RepID=A0A7W6NM05_9HYPH|nr:hypothetical protein [Gellertiella hungarica]
MPALLALPQNQHHLSLANFFRPFIWIILCLRTDPEEKSQFQMAHSF